MRTSKPPFLSVAQAAQELHITPRAVLHRIRVGTLAATKLDPDKVTSAFLIPSEEIERAKTDAGKARSA